MGAGRACRSTPNPQRKKKKSSLSQLCCGCVCLLTRYIFMLPELQASLDTPADPVCIIIAPVTDEFSHAWGSAK